MRSYSVTFYQNIIILHSVSSKVQDCFLRFEQAEKACFLGFKDDFGITNAFPFIIKFNFVKFFSAYENNLFYVETIKCIFLIFATLSGIVMLVIL